MLKLKKIRMSIGITQAQLAKEIKVTPEHVCLIETGNRNPSWEVAQRLERFFNIPASELLAESEDSEDSTSATNAK